MAKKAYKVLLFVIIMIFTLKFIMECSNYLQIDTNKNETKRLNYKYALLWANPKNAPFLYFGEGRKGFELRNCKYKNCYITSNKRLIPMKQYNAVIFSGPDVFTQLQLSMISTAYSEEDLDSHTIFYSNHFRSSHQKYVFASIESTHNYPICSDKLNGFFNWTWTYKLDSDIIWGYVVIRDSNNRVIGPKTDMKWIKKDDMLPVTKNITEKLSFKSKTAAWLVSNCATKSLREDYVIMLNKALKKYNLNVDIFGRCGDLECPESSSYECNEMLGRDYYFYLAFENALSEDYVTEKLLIPLQHDIVPIVYGGANYTRFMPDGIYLNAMEMVPEKLAGKMQELIINPDKYLEYFKWKNHYKYSAMSASKDTNEYCRFCEMLNSREEMEKATVYNDFMNWWTPQKFCSNI